MKKLTALLSVLVMLFLCVLSVSAADDYVMFDLADSTTAEKVVAKIGAGKDSATITENGIVAAGKLVEFKFQDILPDGVNVYDYPVMMVEYSDATTATNIRVDWRFGGNGNNYSLSDNVTKTTEGVTFDFVASYQKVIAESYVDSYAHLISFYPILGENDSVTIKKVVFFKSADDYQAYRDANPLASSKPIEAAKGEAALLFNVGEKSKLFYTDNDNVMCTVTYKDNYAIVTSENGPEDGGTGDPHIIINTNNKGFNGDAYPWIKMRIRNLSDATTFEMHFGSKEETAGNITAPTCTHFPISAHDEDFVEYVFNIQDYNKATKDLVKSVWTGTITQIRFDCMWISEPSGQVPTGSQMEIDYIGFFGSEEEAKEFVPAEETETEKPVKNSGKATPAWKFRTQADIDAWSMFGLRTTWNNGILQLIPLNNDPQLAYNLSEEEQFDASEFPYFAMRYNFETDVVGGQLFYITSQTPEIPSNSSIRIYGDGKWRTLVVDMRRFNAPAIFSGICSRVRLDPIAAADHDAILLLDGMGYFRTVTDAINYFENEQLTADYSASAEFSDRTQKAIIPGGTLYDGYVKSDFMLSSNKAEGTGTSPVVYYTDADGNKTIVPLCYTTSAGYTTFVANKAGSYTLGYNQKAYTDIAEHWGESYINFVSDRTLFGGTSPTEFSPDETMTRGMFITVLGRMHGVDTSKFNVTTGYKDVKTTEYYAPYISWAIQYDLMPGTSAETFAPDEMISRATMASVIAKYINAFNYEFKCYNDPVAFTDISGLDKATQDAIKIASDAGIINGKGNGIFDPNAGSTRAEVATVMERVIKAVLGVNMAKTEYTNEYITRDRIRIGTWGYPDELATPELFKMVVDLGVDFLPAAEATLNGATRDFMLNYCDKYGIELYMKEYPLSENDYSKGVDPVEVTSEYIDHPSFAGNYFTDEPGINYMTSLIGTMAEDYMEALPGKRPYVNLLPMYANESQLYHGASAANIEVYDADPELYRKYCQTWFDTTPNADYICVDIYPFYGSAGKKTGTYKDYCESINQIATVARENDAEFWCFIQAHGWGGFRPADEADYRWQCYTLMSYGCTAYLLYVLADEVNGAPMNTATLSTGMYYEDCKTVMWELRRLSDTFIQYKNLGAFTVNYTDKTPYLYMSNEYKDFTVLSEVNSPNPLLVGCFEKKEGEGYAFTIVNMIEVANNRSATAEFKLDGDYTVTVYSDEDPTVITPNADGYYTINLDCGQGVFVTLA